jgi:hypothetical protein
MRHADCASALRGLSAHTLRDIGMVGCVHDTPEPMRSGWAFNRRR